MTNGVTPQNRDFSAIPGYWSIQRSWFPFRNTRSFTPTASVEEAVTSYIAKQRFPVSLVDIERDVHQPRSSEESNTGLVDCVASLLEKGEIRKATCISTGRGLIHIKTSAYGGPYAPLYETDKRF
ncbi:hypothetical protein CMO92_02765 [Candidatus Woesearchaeota archaeon]|nr:hypothetical protein [Candidatus Woesearchaeota archaeon]